MEGFPGDFYNHMANIHVYFFKVDILLTFVYVCIQDTCFSHAGLIDWVGVSSRPPSWISSKLPSAFRPCHIFFFWSMAAQPDRSHLPTYSVPSVICFFLILTLPFHSFLQMPAELKLDLRCLHKKSVRRQGIEGKTGRFLVNGPGLLLISYVELTYLRLDVVLQMCLYLK